MKEGKNIMIQLGGADYSLKLATSKYVTNFKIGKKVQF